MSMFFWSTAGNAPSCWKVEFLWITFLQVTYPFPWQAAAYAMVDGVLSVLRNLPLLDASGAALGYEVWRNPAQTKL